MNLSIELTTLLSGAIIGIVWLVRLEGRVFSAHEKAIDLYNRVQKLDEKHDALDSKIMDKLSYIERSLSKIEGRLSIDTNKEG
jgi:hypothetical protein